MLFNQKLESKISILIIVIVRLRLIKFHNYDDKMLSIVDEEFDNRILISFFKGFLESKRQL